MQDFTRSWSVWRSCARMRSLARWTTTLTGLGWPATLRPPSAPAVRAKVCCGAWTRSYGRSPALRTTLASSLTALFTGNRIGLYSARSMIFSNAEPRVELQLEEDVSSEWEWPGLELLTTWRSTYTTNLQPPASTTPELLLRSMRTDTHPPFTTGWQTSPLSTQTIAMNLGIPQPLRWRGSPT